VNKVNKIYKALKEGLISFDGAHAIHTPQALVEEVLSKIALQGDILVMFNVEFVISLVYTYNIAPENITFYSDHDNKSRICSKLGVKYITNLETDMKFDVVIGNPPYQDDSTGNSTKTTNLYAPFFYKGLDLVKSDGVLSMIIPSDWIGPNKSNFKTYMFNNRHLKEVTLHPYQKYFQVKKGTCNVIVDKSYNGDCRFEDVNSNIQSLDLRTVSFLSNDNTNILYRNLFNTYPSMGYRWLRGKVNLNKIVSARSGHELIVSCGREGEPLNTQIIPKSLEATGFGLHKIVMPNVGGTNGDLGNNVKVAEDHHVGGHSVVFLTTKSKAESLNLLTYLNTTPIKALIKSIKKSSPNSKALFEQIPDVDLSKPWTDARVYKHFGFTQQMIDYAQSA
jgi:site-specific DNA-methyltransferase (adenine-specific)